MLQLFHNVLLMLSLLASLLQSIGLQALATQVHWELSPTTSSYSLPWIHCLPSLWCSRQLPTTSTVYSQVETPARKQSTDMTACYFCFLDCLSLLSQSLIAAFGIANLVQDGGFVAFDILISWSSSLYECVRSYLWLIVATRKGNFPMLNLVWLKLIVN